MKRIGVWAGVLVLVFFVLCGIISSIHDSEHTTWNEHSWSPFSWPFSEMQYESGEGWFGSKWKLFVLSRILINYYGVIDGSDWELVHKQNTLSELMELVKKKGDQAGHPLVPESFTDSDLLTSNGQPFSLELQIGATETTVRISAVEGARTLRMDLTFSRINRAPLSPRFNWEK
jgi:hypothetical protein